MNPKLTRLFKSLRIRIEPVDYVFSVHFGKKSYHGLSERLALDVAIELSNDQIRKILETQQTIMGVILDDH